MLELSCNGRHHDFCNEFINKYNTNKYKSDQRFDDNSNEELILEFLDKINRYCVYRRYFLNFMCNFTSYRIIDKLKYILYKFEPDVVKRSNLKKIAYNKLASIYANYNINNITDKNLKIEICVSVGYINYCKFINYNEKQQKYVIKNYKRYTYNKYSYNDPYVKYDDINKLYENMINNNYAITSNILSYMCDAIYMCNLEKILLTKITFDDKCFENLLKNPDYKKMIDCIINYGFILKYDNIISLIKNKILYSKIDKFNIDIDDNISLYSTIYDYHDYHKILNYNYTIESLYKACENSNYKTIKYIIESGVEPDIQCLKILCRGKNYHHIKLIKKYIKPNNDCLQEYIKHSDDKILQLMTLSLNQSSE